MSGDKIEEDSKSQTSIPKKVFLSFNYKRTGMGGVSDTIIISLKSGKIINSRLNLSRSGNHGIRQYVLFPGKYLVYDVSRSNSGNLYIIVSIIKLNEDGSIEKLQEWKLYEDKNQKMLLSNLPENVIQILINNKNKLPLFRYIEDQ